MNCHHLAGRFMVMLVALQLTLPARANEPDFARDVRPILSQYCFKCHGPDEKTREGGLRLDDRASALSGGDTQVPAIVAGNVSASELIKRITSADPDTVMPPPSTKRSLNAQQIAILQRWIASGATYVDHWAFQPVSDPTATAADNAPPAANSPAQAGFVGASLLDTLVAQAAAQHQLSLAPPADRGTWLRRAYLDVVGLPPTYDEVLNYQQDTRVDAKERMVDRLLASPAFGERWGRRWLDLARYADTNGYEKDRPRSIWPYRDWVIRAINDDMPLHDFAVKQLAGDLLPNPSTADLIATGFHRNTMINEEGGIDPLEYRYYAMVDRVNTTSTAWLGLTVGCAQCHDHKYDPITQLDYYGLMALLNNAEEPEMEVYDPEIAARQKQADAEIERLRGERVQHFPSASAATPFQPAAVDKVQSAHKLQWTRQRADAFTSTGKPSANDTTTITIAAGEPSGDSTAGSLVAIRLRAVPSILEDKQTSLGWSATQNFVITTARLEDDARSPILLGSARATFEQPGYPASASLDNDKKSGWAVGGHAGQPCEIVWTLAQPLAWPSEKPLRLILEQNHGSQHLLRGFELALAFDDTPPEQLAAARQANIQRSFQQWLDSTTQHIGSWDLLKPQTVSANMARLEPQPDGSYLAIGDISKRDYYQFQLELPAGTTALMIEGLTDPSMPKRGPGRTYYEGPIGDFFLSEVSLVDSQQQPIAFGDAWVDFAQSGREAAKAFDGDPLTGWSIDGEQGSAHRMVVSLKEPLASKITTDLQLLFERYYAAPLGRVRLWSTSAKGLDAAAARLSPAAQNQLVSSSDEARRRELAWDWFLSEAPELAPINARIKELEKARPKFPTTLVMQPRPAGFVRATHRYHRGEFLNPREEVPAAIPKFLTSTSKSPPKDRLELAYWLMDPDHPLVSRVLANRYWSAMMGRGLVTTEEDFGFQGSFPTNQALLDYLANELVGASQSRGQSQLLWSFKRWLRQLLLSDTYARASNIRSADLAADPINQFTARVSRKRMEAEQLRDAALASAGLLTRTVGGPSVYPPQPASVTTEGTYGKLPWPESHGADRYRRAIYTFSKRTAPFAMLTTFDAPSGESCVARRESGDTPLQALTVLNDALFMEAAKELGYRVATPSNSPDAIVRQLFHKILLREPTSAELSDMSQYLVDQSSAVAKSTSALQALGKGNSETNLREQPDAMIAAATLLARVLFNTDEFINRN